MKIAVLGATGMLGSAMFRVLQDDAAHQVYAVVRNPAVASQFFPHARAEQIVAAGDADNPDVLAGMFAQLRPQVVINCVGLVKQLGSAKDPLQALPINALLPHRLARLAKATGARLVHISTDCVFSGTRGQYREEDAPDADDLYGRSKLLGEVHEPHAITLRTSIIGHELQGARSLIGWFLAQQGPVRGFGKALFSGLPTVELARLVRDVVLPKPELHGLYHVAAQPIDKLSLLRLVAQAYGKRIDIVPDDSLVIDRSLNADRFHRATGYVAPDWPALVQAMQVFR